MTIKYNLTEADSLAFQEHYLKTSPLIKRNRRIVIILAMALMLLLTFFLKLRHGVLVALSTAFISTVVMLLWMLVVYRFLPFIHRALSKSEAQDVKGEVELEISPQGLHAKSRAGETKIFWDSVGEVATTPTHTFIYLGNTQAFIIPNRHIVSGNYPAFMQAFADVYAKRRDVALQSASLPDAAPIREVSVAPTVEETVPLGLGKSTHDADR